MGNIVCSRRQNEDTVLVEVLMKKEEYLQLKGEFDNVCMFSATVECVPSRVSLRGRNEATKYFLIPKQLRRKLPVKGNVSCQRLKDISGRSIFVYVIDPTGSKDAIVL